MTSLEQEKIPTILAYSSLDRSYFHDPVGYAAHDDRLGSYLELNLTIAREAFFKSLLAAENNIVNSSINLVSSLPSPSGWFTWKDFSSSRSYWT